MTQTKLLKLGVGEAEFSILVTKSFGCHGEEYKTVSFSKVPTYNRDSHRKSAS